jgi:RNA recognition motif. (a.k.a. RRM, RBD, or RNP domain)
MDTTIRNDTTNDDVISAIDPILLSTKRVVFVGGLPTATTTSMIRAAMIPFGTIQSIDMVRLTRSI